MRRVLERLNNICLFIFSSCRLDAAVSRQKVEHVGIFPVLDLFWQPSEFLRCEALLLSSAFIRPLSHVFVIASVFLPLGARPDLIVSLFFFFFYFLTDLSDLSLTFRSNDTPKMVWGHGDFYRCCLRCQKVQRESCLSGLCYFPADTQGGNQMRRAIGRDG